MSDPVGERSGFLKTYMSSHPDTLVAYAKWYGKVEEPIVSAEMSSIDTKSMTLTCKLKSGSTKPVVVKFNPPLANYEAVKPRLLEMKAIAQEGLGMIKTPQITTYNFPLRALRVAAAVGLLLFTYLPPEDTINPVLKYGVIMRNAMGGPKVNAGIAYTVGTLHILETAYMIHLCVKHRTPFLIGAAYVLSTAVMGFPFILDFRKKVQDARINSVMKIE